MDRKQLLVELILKAEAKLNNGVDQDEQLDLYNEYSEAELEDMIVEGLYEYIKE